MHLLLFLISLGTSIASFKLLWSHVIALFQNYEHNGLVYVIDINKHVLPSCYIIPLFQSCCSETLIVGLINTVIIVTYFAWDQHSVFDIVIVTCECAVSKQQTLLSFVYPCYSYTCLTVLFILFCHSICVVLDHRSCF